MGPISEVGVHRSIRDNVDFFAANRRADRCLAADHAKGTCFASRRCRRAVKVVLMNHFGYLQQFSEPRDLTAWASGHSGYKP
jgi:hypothetical protein